MGVEARHLYTFPEPGKRRGLPLRQVEKGLGKIFSCQELSPGIHASGSTDDIDRFIGYIHKPEPRKGSWYLRRHRSGNMVRRVFL